MIGCAADNTSPERQITPGEVAQDDSHTGDQYRQLSIRNKDPILFPTELEAPEQDDSNNDSSIEKPEKVDVKGIYLNPVSLREDKIDQFIDYVKATKLNAVVMDIKDDYGKLTYDSNIDMVNELGSDSNPPIKDLKAFIKRLKDEGIYTIGRIVVFKDPYLIEKRPEYAIKRNDGSIWKNGAGTPWIDPYKQDAWGYITNISKEIADSGIDEIQYDYIRFPENAKKVNLEVTYDNPENIDKQVVIQNFLKFSSEQLKDKPVYVSADVFGLVTSSNDDMGIGQNWESLSPYLDYISPMTYPSHYAPNTYGIGNPDAEPYELMKNAMQDAVTKNEKLKQNGEDPAIIRPWIQDFDYKRAYSVTDVKNQMKALEEQGVTQYLIWNAQNVYTKEAVN
ncbi:putative glycoside hydrolase [Ornithinibacillus halophilus]|uniref:DUF4015 domain-containing protein n=1 Tax=Ornithinibacillus halophilus TaxID=930117 RepID=A0A1M5JYQ6_9BACI|nr:putative glycoside hydrolase [Ornithinibacillus halophilus]SHG45664.1 hypothetical protein SAMN05216225_103426 [Ornithinibacillus halophilus]